MWKLRGSAAGPLQLGTAAKNAPPRSAWSQAPADGRDFAELPQLKEVLPGTVYTSMKATCNGPCSSGCGHRGPIFVMMKQQVRTVP